MKKLAPQPAEARAVVAGQLGRAGRKAPRPHSCPGDARGQGQDPGLGLLAGLGALAAAATAYQTQRKPTPASPIPSRVAQPRGAEMATGRTANTVPAHALAMGASRNGCE